MIARVKIAAGRWTCCNLNSLLEEAFYQRARAIAFLTNPVVTPDKQPVGCFRTVHQLADTHEPAEAIVSELCAVVSGIDRREAVFRIPLVGAGTSGAALGRVDLVEGVVAGGGGRSIDSLGQAVAQRIIAVAERPREHTRIGDDPGQKLIRGVIAKTVNRGCLRPSSL